LSKIQEEDFEFALLSKNPKNKRETVPRSTEIERPVAGRVEIPKTSPVVWPKTLGLLVELDEDEEEAELPGLVD